MQYFSTAKSESRRESTALIEIKLVSEGRQGKQSIALRNSIHGPVQHLLGLLCFGCSKQTSGLCGGVSVFAIFVESFTILERR